MFPLQSAYKIPLGESFIISDEIADRDRIIDALLDKIHNKYIHLAKENEKLKKKNEELTNEINYSRFVSPPESYPRSTPERDYLWSNNVTSYDMGQINRYQHNTNQYNTNPSNRIKGPLKRRIPKSDNINYDDIDNDEYDEIIPLSPKSRSKSKSGSRSGSRSGSISGQNDDDPDYYILATESTMKGYELCKTFQNYKFKKDELVNIYDMIIKKMTYGKKRKMPGAHVNPKSYPNEDVNYTIPTNIALDGDFVENIWHDYNPFKLNKKYMLSLVNAITEYVSDNVYVEKVLERLNEIIERMNNDKQLLEKIFGSVNILGDGEKGKIGIIFKGGNVYKLYTHILNNRLDHDIFQTYFTDVERFFKKSDCDFGLVFIITDKNGRDRFEHLKRTKDNVNVISTIQYMILNEFRNNVLEGPNPYDYIAICGKNDRVITSKLNIIMRNMLDVIFVGRLDFEKSVLRALLNIVEFGENHNMLKDYLTHVNGINNRGKRLLDVFEETDNLRNIRNQVQIYGVTNGKFLDWFKVCLAYALRNKTIMTDIPKTEEFKNFSPEPNFVEKLQKLSTDTMEWRDVRTIYDVVDISNIIIGDSSYPNMSLKRNVQSDADIYNLINSNKDKYTETTSKIVARRMERLKRLHSNRNDFFVEMGKGGIHKADDKKFRDYLVQNDIMQSSSIPYENMNNELSTPFYISINKKIGGRTENAASERGINSLIHNIHRYSKYGFIGHDPKNPTNYDTRILFENIKDFCKINGTESEGYLAEPPKTVSEFSLGRLMVSSCIVFITRDNLFVPVPLSAEYIDLSYSFAGDNKATSYEYIDGFIKINGKEETLLLDSIAKQFLRLADDVENNSFPDINIPDGMERNVYIKKLANAIRSFDECAISKDEKLEERLYSQIHDMKHIPGAELQIGRLAKICKHYTIYGYGITDKRIVCDNIMFPKLSTFIVDLYMILFVDTRYPWGDNKYMKRLNRFVYFVLFSRLRYINFNNLHLLLRDVGIDINENNFRNINNAQNVKYIPNINNPVSFGRAVNIISMRTDGLLQDNKDITYDENDNLFSICSIDCFMYNFHLLDFMSLHYEAKYYDTNPFVRCQFVLKRPIGKSNDCQEYILISFNKDEITNMDDDKKSKIMNIIGRINFDYNENVILPFNERTKRYVRVTDDDTDPHIKNMYNYFRNIESLRERILITLYNYLYVSINTVNGTKEIINPDPLHIMLNLYDGDIDRILAVM